MIRIVQINSITKMRVKDMVLGLMPEVGYVRVSNSGIVTMKKKWWSFSRVRTTVTDLIVGVLPKKVASFALKVNGRGNSRVFNEHIAMLLSLGNYSIQFDACDYLWEQYQKYCMEVPTIIINTNNEMAVLQKKSYLPALSKVSTGTVSAIAELIQGKQPSRIQRRFVKKLNEMRENLPVPMINFGNIFAFS